MQSSLEKTKAMMLSEESLIERGMFHGVVVVAFIFV